MNLLDSIRTAILSRSYRVSGHAAAEMLADEVSELDVIESTLSGEVVESYPQALPFPACLVSGKTVIQAPIHSAWAFDAAKCYAMLVTVYRPDPESEDMTMQGPQSCPRCNGNLEYNRQIEQSVREGNDVALVTVTADICTRCGEILLHPGMTDVLSNARILLQQDSALPAVGRVFDLRHRAA